MPSVLYIEDDPLWRNVVRTTIKRCVPNAQVCVTPTAAEGMALWQNSPTDVVLLDLLLPDATGLETIANFCSFGARRVLLLTSRMDDAVLFQLTRPEVAGLLWKSTYIRAQLVAAIDVVLRGQRYVAPEAKLAWDTLRTSPTAFFKILSARELDLLPLYAAGASDDEIAVREGITRFTAKSHREHIMSKLDLHSSAQLIQWALNAGFVAPKQRPQVTGQRHAVH